MFQFSLTGLNKMGEPHPTYGQSYWAESSEADLPLMFNSTNGDIEIGDTITAEEKVIKMSKKGTEYMQLRKVRVIASEAPKAVKQAVNGSQAPSGWDTAKLFMQLDRIEKKLDRLSGDDELDKASQDIQQALADGGDMPEDFLT